MTATGSFELTLTRANGSAWKGDLRVAIRDQTNRLIYDKRAQYETPVVFAGLARVPEGRHLFSLRTRCWTPVSLYTTIDSDRKERAIPMLIRGGLADRYGARITFPAFDRLPQALRGLADDVGPGIDTSAEVPVRSGDWTAYYGRLHGDQAQYHRRIACLLNLYSKMTQRTPLGVDVSLGVDRPWDFVHTVFHVRQDRIYAKVRPDLAARMPRILGELRDRPNRVFRAHDAGEHNVPVPPGFERYPVTFKSDERDRIANLQLSFASRVVDADTVWILDADIDLHTGFEHTIEAVRNWVSGGRTNPYDVHQLLASTGHQLLYEPYVPCRNGERRSPRASRRARPRSRAAGAVPSGTP